MRRRLWLALACSLAACSSGSGTPDAGPGMTPDAGQDAGGDAGLPYDPTCSQPGTPGNDAGVGKFCCDGQPGCTSSGLSCQFPSPFCTTVSPPPLPTQWFCTNTCTCDSQCGYGAVCFGGQPDGGGQLGCVPQVCGAPAVGNPCWADGGKMK